MIVFGSGRFTNDVVDLKHQGACQKLMIGWHKHQGVSETPKNADVICEQPLSILPNQIFLITNHYKFHAADLQLHAAADIVLSSNQN